MRSPPNNPIRIITAAADFGMPVGGVAASL
jgi:hypothetical protein